MPDKPERTSTVSAASARLTALTDPDGGHAMIVVAVLWFTAGTPSIDAAGQALGE